VQQQQQQQQQHQQQQQQQQGIAADLFPRLTWWVPGLSSRVRCRPASLTLPALVLCLPCLSRAGTSRSRALVRNRERRPRTQRRQTRTPRPTRSRSSCTMGTRVRRSSGRRSSPSASTYANPPFRVLPALPAAQPSHLAARLCLSCRVTGGAHAGRRALRRDRVRSGVPDLPRYARLSVSQALICARGLMFALLCEPASHFLSCMSAWLAACLQSSCTRARRATWTRYGATSSASTATRPP
jgi:hypothetical protein